MSQKISPMGTETNLIYPQAVSRKQPLWERRQTGSHALGGGKRGFSGFSGGAPRGGEDTENIPRENGNKQEEKQVQGIKKRRGGARWEGVVLGVARGKGVVRGGIGCCAAGASGERRY